MPRKNETGQRRFWERCGVRDVVFSCDDRGAKFLRVTVWSLLERYRGAEPIRVNVLEGFGGHSEESKRLLAEVFKPRDAASGDAARDGMSGTFRSFFRG